MILIIDKNKKRRDTISDIFHYMGILSYAIEPERAYSEISADYRAVLISEPRDFTDAPDYIKRLRQYCGITPIFTISDEEPDGYINELADMTFSGNISSSVLVNSIIDYQEQRNLPSLGKYLLMGLDAGCDLGEVRYMSHPLSFTKTETMILRYLTITYPRYADYRDILRHCFRSTRSPEPPSIRTHISIINKKFRLHKGRPLISSNPGEGYIIATPEVINGALKNLII